MFDLDTPLKTAFGGGGMQPPTTTRQPFARPEQGPQHPAKLPPEQVTMSLAAAPMPRQGSALYARRLRLCEKRYAWRRSRAEVEAFWTALLIWRKSQPDYDEAHALQSQHETTIRNAHKARRVQP